MSKFNAWKTDVKGNGGGVYKVELKAAGENAAKKSTINVDSTVEYQKIIGFGGAFNEVGWEAYNSLDDNKKDFVLNSLFTKEGCNFNLCRTPIGASDFAMDAYSLNDVENDFKMEHFSIERDKKGLIPYIKEAMKKNPEMKIWSCPWSPPYWMKTNGDMCNGGELKDEQNVLKAYADYLVKYIQAYRAEGIEIYGFCVQNETDVINVYPTSTMEPELMKKFIRAYLLPALVKAEKRPLKTELWVGTIREVLGYADIVVQDPSSKQFISGIGYQYSAPYVVKDSYEKHPEIKLIHTESPCHNGANSWDEAKEIFNDMISYLENGCTNYCYWNMVLNETGLSTWNWKQNSLININRETKEIIYNPEYFVMKHFSQFIQRDASRINTSGEHEDSCIAFKNPDGSIIVIASNFGENEKTLQLAIDGETHNVILDSESIYTIELS